MEGYCLIEHLKIIGKITSIPHHLHINYFTFKHSLEPTT